MTGPAFPACLWISPSFHAAAIIQEISDAEETRNGGGMSLERIVRPFQTRDVTPPRRIVDVAQSQEPEDVVLTIGKSGSGNVMHGSISFSMTKYMDTKLKEDIAGTINGQPASQSAINDALYNNPGASVNYTLHSTLATV